MHILPFAVVWGCLAAALAGLALYRKLITRHEDDYLHVTEGEAKLIPQQIEMARKLDVLDHWGKILTIVIVASGLLLAVAFLYQLWIDSEKPLG